jgi:hypothetical protein
LSINKLFDIFIVEKKITILMDPNITNIENVEEMSAQNQIGHFIDNFCNDIQDNYHIFENICCEDEYDNIQGDLVLFI